MSTIAEHLAMLRQLRSEIYGRHRLVDGHNHSALQCDQAFAMQAKLLVSVHLDELLAAHPPREHDIERPDLNRFAYDHHWQRPDGTIYTVDSSD